MATKETTREERVAKYVALDAAETVLRSIAQALDWGCFPHSMTGDGLKEFKENFDWDDDAYLRASEGMWEELWPTDDPQHDHDSGDYECESLRAQVMAARILSAMAANPAMLQRLADQRLEFVEAQLRRVALAATSIHVS